MLSLRANGVGALIGRQVVAYLQLTFRHGSQGRHKGCSPRASDSYANLSAQFYQQDIVRRVQPPSATNATSSQSREVNGIVMRCWHDAEDVAPQTPFSDPLMRPLHQGEVGVSFYRDEPDGTTRREFDRQILPESELVLVDRTFHPGDFCKRSIDDVRSGVVMNAHVNGRCEHVVSGERLEGWTTLEELSDRTYAEVGDYVTYDDWIGQVRADSKYQFNPFLTIPPGN